MWHRVGEDVLQVELEPLAAVHVGPAGKGRVEVTVIEVMSGGHRDEAGAAGFDPGLESLARVPPDVVTTRHESASDGNAGRDVTGEG